LEISNRKLENPPPAKVFSGKTSKPKEKVKTPAAPGDRVELHSSRISRGKSGQIAASRAHPWEKRGMDPLKITRLDEAHQAYGLTGKGVMVAVIDSGFDPAQGTPEVWQDFGGESSAPFDRSKHGTDVAGFLKQAAPASGLAALKVDKLYDVKQPDGSTRREERISDSAIIKAVQWSIENSERYNIKVINLSLGHPRELMDYGQIKPDRFNSPAYQLPVSHLDQALTSAVKAGITVIGIAGNNGPAPFTLEDPGDLPQVLTVGAAKDEKRVSGLSARGYTFKGEQKPDLLAPGENLWGQGSKELIKGTSFAAPIVAGIVALLYEARPEITPREVKEILTNTARKLDKKFGPEAQGAGMVDAKAALDRLMQKQTGA